MLILLLTPLFFFLDLCILDDTWNVDNVSKQCFGSCETLTTMVTRDDNEPMASRNKVVNLLSLCGICFAPFANDTITFPRADKGNHVP